MKYTHFIFILLVSLPFLSLNNHENPAPRTGTFGVCNCDENSSSASKFEVTFNENNTFTYIDYSDLAKPIDTKGTWRMDGNNIVLENYQSSFPINTKWKVDNNNDNCIKSSRGMEFTRLCLIKPCQ